MKKIVLGLLLSMLLMTTACGNDPVARLEKAVKKTGELEQYKMSMSGDIGVNMQELEGETAQSEMGNITLEMKADVDKDKTRADINYSMMGISMNMEMYGDSKQSITKMPMSDKYIVMDVGAEGATDVQKSQESLKKLSDELYADIVKRIKENGEIALEKTELEMPDGKVNVDKGTVKLESKDVKAILISTVEKLYSDEEFIKLMGEQSGKAPSKEEIDAMVAEMKSSFENIEIENFEYAVYIDGDDYIVGQDIKMDLVDSKNGTEGLSMDLKFRIWDMGNDQNIEFPELTEENSMSFEDYMKSLEFQMPENMEGIEGMENFNPEDFNLEDMDLENMEIPEVTIE